MILQALVEYYQRLTVEGYTGIASEGFERKEIPFLIVLGKDGKFIGLQDTREGEGKKKRGRIYLVPKGIKKTSGNASNLLWDTPNYVFGKAKVEGTKNNTKAKEQHSLFIKTIQTRFPSPKGDEGIRGVISFLERGEFTPIFNHPLWPEIKESYANLTFKLENDEELVCQRPEVIQVVATSSIHNKTRNVCLITGQNDEPQRLHTAVKGVRGSQTSGANLVSFNLRSFDSYGKEQGANAPIGKKAEFAYTTALNHLLSHGSTQKFQIGDATTVFWAENKNQMENVFQELFGYVPDNQKNEQDYRQLLGLFRSPESGVEQANLDASTKFYVLGLAPNAARISVRFWYAGTVGSLAGNIYQHFEDLSMVKSINEWRRIDLRSLLRSTALREKDENVIPNLAGDVMKSILTGTPYPQTLLSSVLTRIKSEQSAKGPNGKSNPNVTYNRAALIKAILVRDTRCNDKNKQEVSMSLDTTNSNPGYVLGRLFALLEKTQERASPGINATIRDRFYGAASTSPVTAFPYLMKLKNFHIAKLENKGEVINTEKQIGEILSKLEAASAFPAHLSLQDQGRFAVGYYHQRQDLFTKKEKLNIKEGKE
jgi:CRISPR-associated protein Csd1